MNAPVASAPAVLLAHHTHLRAACRRMCGPLDDLDELVQDTYVELIRHYASYRGEASFSTWAVAVARSQLHRQRRRRRRYTAGDAAIEFAQHSFPEFLGRAPDQPETHAQRQQLRVLLEGCLGELSELDRAVFMARQIEGLRATEVAETLGLSTAAVKSRLHRARRTLRALLTKSAPFR